MTASAAWPARSADLAGSESILPEHLSEAIQYRTHQLIQN